jgi:hypothetical protein
LVPFALGIRAAELALWCPATGLVEVLTGRTADITALAIATLAASLHRTLHTGARPHACHHLAEAFDRFLGQLLTHLREGAGAGDGGLGFELGRLHDFLTDGLLVGLVSHRGLGDFAAQAHGALTGLAHDVLLRLEVAAQRTALVVVQVLEQLLRIELLVERRIAGAALAFAGAEVTALAVHGAGFTTRGVVTPDFAGPTFLAAALVGAEVAARRALAFGRTFLTGSIFAGTVFAGTFLGRAGVRQGREGKPAQRREQRTGDNGQFHSFFLVCRAGSTTRRLRFNAPAGK